MVDQIQEIPNFVIVHNYAPDVVIWLVSIFLSLEELLSHGVMRKMPWSVLVCCPSCEPCTDLLVGICCADWGKCSVSCFRTGVIHLSFCWGLFCTCLLSWRFGDTLFLLFVYSLYFAHFWIWNVAIGATCVKVSLYFAHFWIWNVAIGATSVKVRLMQSNREYTWYKS